MPQRDFLCKAPSSGLCTKNTSRALIERPYSCAPQAVGAVYDRPGFFVQSPSSQRRGMLSSLPFVLQNVQTRIPVGNIEQPVCGHVNIGGLRSKRDIRARIDEPLG